MKHGKIVVSQFKDVDKAKRQVLSYPSTFGVQDAGDDIVEPGAFTRTISAWGPEGKNRIKALYQHDPTSLLGRPLSLTQDNIGLLADTQMSDTALARDTMTLIEDKVITEQSIGFDTIQSDFDDDGVRHLRELRLWEYSFVTWGMNEVTPIVGVKSARSKAAKEQIERIEKALKDSRFDSDEMPHMLQIALSNLKESLDSSDDTPDFSDPDALTAWLTEQEKSLRLFKSEIKVGRVLSANNRALVTQAIDALQSLLEADSKHITPPSENPIASFAEEMRASTAGLRAASLADELREFARSVGN